jgi:RNA polymerase sigma-70 factor (ECF subfamily)
VAEQVDRDAELLEAWRGGEQAAGEQLFDRHADAVARFFENKVARGAEDLVQAAFVRMLEGRDRFRGDGSFRAFVFGVARNVLREHVRELVRFGQVDPSVDSMAALSPGPSTVVGMRQEHQLMLEGLRHLAIDDQIMLELFYWEELSGEEVAKILGIPPSSTRRRLSEARARLDAKMAEIAASPALLDRTLRNLESWVADVRVQLGAKKRRRKR